MNKSLPDKEVRKAIFTAFDGTVVSTKTINVFDSLYPTTSTNDSAYVLMTAQGNDTDNNKCDSYWNHDILLEVAVWYKGTGNPGSGVLADDILDSLRNTLKDGLTLGGGLTQQSQVMTFPNDIVSNLPNGTLIRKFMRLEMRIN